MLPACSLRCANSCRSAMSCNNPYCCTKLYLYQSWGCLWHLTSHPHYLLVGLASALGLSQQCRHTLSWSRLCTRLCSAGSAHAGFRQTCPVMLLSFYIFLPCGLLTLTCPKRCSLSACPLSLANSCRLVYRQYLVICAHCCALVVKWVLQA